MSKPQRPPTVKCKVCNKHCGKRAIYLYETPSGSAWVCGKECFRAWEED